MKKAALIFLITFVFAPQTIFACALGPHENSFALQPAWYGTFNLACISSGDDLSDEQTFILLESILLVSLLSALCFLSNKKAKVVVSVIVILWMAISSYFYFLLNVG